MLEEWLAGVQASYRSANINTQQGEEETGIFRINKIGTALRKWQA